MDELNYDALLEVAGYDGHVGKVVKVESDWYRDRIFLRSIAEEGWQHLRNGFGLGFFLKY